MSGTPGAVRLRLRFGTPTPAFVHTLPQIVCLLPLAPKDPHMSDANQFRLPTGLPTHLCSGKEGFDALCSLLSIVSTKQKQAIANAPAIKRFLKANGHTPPRQSKTAERLRHSLLTFYGDPEARRRLWRLYHQSANDESSQLIPSLEHAAFNEYDESLLTADPDPAELADCSEFHSPASEHDAWQTPALAALPRLRRDFADWHSLGDDRRRVVLTAAFATVTLLARLPQLVAKKRVTC